jgi:hypothetical protein
MVSSFNFFKQLTQLPYVTWQTNIGFWVSLGLLLMYIIVVILGMRLDRKRPVSNLKLPA